MVTLRESSLHSLCTRACLNFTTLTFSTQAKCRNGVVCVSVVCVLQSVSACAWMGVCGVCVSVHACVRVRVYQVCLYLAPCCKHQAWCPTRTSHWESLCCRSSQKFSPPKAFTRVNRYRRRGIEHQTHSTITQTLSKQGCDYNKTLPCRHYCLSQESRHSEIQS